MVGPSWAHCLVDHMSCDHRVSMKCWAMISFSTGFGEGIEGIWSGSATATGTIGACQYGAHRDEERQGQTTEGLEESVHDVHATWGSKLDYVGCKRAKGTRWCDLESWEFFQRLTCDVQVYWRKSRSAKQWTGGSWYGLVLPRRKWWSSIRFLQINDWWISWCQPIIPQKRKHFGDWYTWYLFNDTFFGYAMAAMVGLFTL